MQPVNIDGGHHLRHCQTSNWLTAFPDEPLQFLHSIHGATGCPVTMQKTPSRQSVDSYGFAAQQTGGFSRRNLQSVIGGGGLRLGWMFAWQICQFIGDSGGKAFKIFVG